MTEGRARQLEWLLVTVAVLALGLGLEGGFGWEHTPAAIAALQAVLATPTDGALLLLGTGLATRALRQRISPILCFAAAAGWAAAWLLDGGRQLGAQDELGAREITALSVVLLTSGTLLQQLLPKSRLAFVVSATLLLVSTVGGGMSLVATGLDFARAATALEPFTAWACSALGAIAFGQLFGSYSTSLDTALSRLHWPIACAGSAGTFFAAQLIAQDDAVSAAQQVGSLIAASALMLCLTFAAFTVVKLVSEVVDVRGSSARWKRLLRRQREIMHVRTTALKRTQAHYKELFANVPAPVLLTHPSGTVLAANPAMLALLGAVSEDQVRAASMASFYADPEERTKLIAAWAASDKTVHQGEVKLRRIDGEQRSVLFTSRVVRSLRYGDIDYIQGTFTDITELRRAEATKRNLEANLRLSQKLESVGRLAAGIAHEINTPMQYIGDNVYFLRESFEALHALLEHQRALLATAVDESSARLAAALRELEAEVEVDGILEAMPGALTRTEEGIKSVNRIVAAMKELAHPGDGAKTSTDVNAVINTAVTVTRNAHKTIAAVTLDLAAVPNVLTYKNELCQVLINLIVNSAHAIEAAQKLDRRAGAIAIRTGADQEALRIDIADNGCGIPESVMDKIFDPFFTTKEVGKGTGQGLALARTTIVEKHGGDIAVQSTVGQGTTFTITLPLGNQGSASS